MSANMLVWIGIPYIADGGWLIEKIHPGTYFAALACAAWLFEGGDPKRRGRRLLLMAPGLLLFLASVFFCLAYAALMTGIGGLITLIDTFLPAGLLGVALADASPRDRQMLRQLLLTLFLVNALVALAEGAASLHLVPIAGNIPDLPGEFRPTGLYDHPLTAAISTMMGLFLRNSVPSAIRTKMVYNGVLILALLSFGGRIAILLTCLGYASLYSPVLRRALLHRKMPLNSCLMIAGCCALLLCGAVIATSVGLSDRLAAHLYWDPSAQSRISQVEILRTMDGVQLAFGIRRVELIALIEPLRLQYGMNVIENFWLLMLCTLGLLCFPVFVVGFLQLLSYLMRSGGLHGRLMVICVLFAASCSNSLGRKSTLLVTLVGCVAALDRGVAEPGRNARISGIRRDRLERLA